ncbi:MAG: hypothetical protein PHS95_02870 [Candidatus Pacebacteria bacterium]|nr:hypothetical protein [Candidatus Paceibacterota bacterium]
MKYKKQIATGVLALSFLVSGSNVFAMTPQDLGIKDTQKNQQKQNKNKTKVSPKKQNNLVGIISALTNTGFTVNVKNLKTKITTSVDVKTDASTMYRKNGVEVTASDLSLGGKVIVIGDLDKTTNIMTAKTVKLAMNTVVLHKDKKWKN